MGSRPQVFMYFTRFVIKYLLTHHFSKAFAYCKVVEKFNRCEWKHSCSVPFVPRPKYPYFILRNMTSSLALRVAFRFSCCVTCQSAVYWSCDLLLSFFFTHDSSLGAFPTIHFLFQSRFIRVRLREWECERLVLSLLLLFLRRWHRCHSHSLFCCFCFYWFFKLFNKFLSYLCFILTVSISHFSKFWISSSEDLLSGKRCSFLCCALASGVLPNEMLLFIAIEQLLYVSEVSGQTWYNRAVIL